MATYVLGKDAKLYYGANATALASLTEIGNVRDLTLTLTAGEADITTRSNSGWKGTAQGLKEASCEFEMVWNPTDAAFDAVQAAFLAGTTLEFAVLSEARTTVGAKGPKATWSITNFTRTEPLEEAVKVSVSLKLATFTEWVSVTS